MKINIIPETYLWKFTSRKDAVIFIGFKLLDEYKSYLIKNNFISAKHYYPKNYTCFGRAGDFNDIVGFKIIINEVVSDKICHKYSLTYELETKIKL